jgi:hypothetical protein
MSDEQIDYWAGIFLQLEQMFGVRSAHHVTFELFMHGNPADNERWIRIYFANAGLLANRREGANVTLAAFFENGPALVMAGALVMDGVQREALGEAAGQLLHRQQIAANVFDEMNAWASQEEDDKRFERTHTVEHRGNRYVEAHYDHHWPRKYKTRGAHV